MLQIVEACDLEARGRRQDTQPGVPRHRLLVTVDPGDQLACAVAIVLNDVPLDTLVMELASSRYAIYQTLLDARPKLRVGLAANGYGR